MALVVLSYILYETAHLLKVFKVQASILVPTLWKSRKSYLKGTKKMWDWNLSALILQSRWNHWRISTTKINQFGLLMWTCLSMKDRKKQFRYWKGHGGEILLSVSSIVGDGEKEWWNNQLVVLAIEPYVYWVLTTTLYVSHLTI